MVCFAFNQNSQESGLIRTCPAPGGPHVPTCACRAPGPDPRRAASKQAGVQMPRWPPLQVGADEEPGLPLRPAGGSGAGGGGWFCARRVSGTTRELPAPTGNGLPKALSVRSLHKRFLLLCRLAGDTVQGREGQPALGTHAGCSALRGASRAPMVSSSQTRIPPHGGPISAQARAGLGGHALTGVHTQGSKPTQG